MDFFHVVCTPSTDFVEIWCGRLINLHCIIAKKEASCTLKNAINSFVLFYGGESFQSYYIGTYAIQNLLLIPSDELA